MASDRREQDRGPPSPQGDGAAGTDSQTSFERELALLQEEYRASLPRKLATLRDAAQLCRQSPADARALERFRRLAHQIYGSASSFGFTEVGLEARRILALLPGSVSDLASLPPESWRDIRIALDAADAAART